MGLAPGSPRLYYSRMSADIGTPSQTGSLVSVTAVYIAACCDHEIRAVAGRKHLACPKCKKHCEWRIKRGTADRGGQADRSNGH
jgi:hypothetical protein